MEKIYFCLIDLTENRDNDQGAQSLPNATPFGTSPKHSQVRQSRKALFD